VFVVSVVFVVIGGAAGEASANCQNEGPYELRQCGTSWFAAPPPGSGVVSAQWWAVGFGNAKASQGAGGSAPDGSGFVSTPTTLGRFIGDDSGLLDAAGLGLIDAGLYGGPTGSLCFHPMASWGLPGIDGCADVNRDSYAGGGANDVGDDILNPY